jgi:uncharacterized DUF497 family protein
MSHKNSFRVLGTTGKGRRLALAITIRDSKIRVIMARDQSHKERIFFATAQKKTKH